MRPDLCGRRAADLTSKATDSRQRSRRSPTRRSFAGSRAPPLPRRKRRSPTATASAFVPRRAGCSSRPAHSTGPGAGLPASLRAPGRPRVPKIIEGGVALKSWRRTSAIKVPQRGQRAAGHVDRHFDLGRAFLSGRFTQRDSIVRPLHHAARRDAGVVHGGEPTFGYFLPPVYYYQFRVRERWDAGLPSRIARISRSADSQRKTRSCQKSAAGRRVGPPQLRRISQARKAISQTPQKNQAEV